MAYSDFNLDRLTQGFGVSFQGAKLFGDTPALNPSNWLVETIEVAEQAGFGTEKSRSERLVSPVLMELVKRNNYDFTIVSGANLDVEPTRGLNGECDFVLTFAHLQDFIQAPVFCITEAKKQDIEQGTIQCAAQLIGAAQFNERAGTPVPILYGCSTTGVEWRFLKFESQTFTFDESRYYITNLAKLLGVLQRIMDQSKAQRAQSA